MSAISSTQCSWLAVVLGLALRLIHYLNGYTVWQDEAAIMVNIIRLSSRELLGPLQLTQAAPPLFLLAQKSLILLFNDSAYTLRFLPFLISCVGLVLFRQALHRALASYWPAVAVLLFSCSDRLLWHACEAKPYAIDASIAVLVLWYFLHTEGWSLARRCLPALVMAPLLVWSSFTACFILGGLVLAWLPLLRSTNWKGWLTFTLFNISLIGAFLALMLGPAARQQNAELDSYWNDHFPNWQDPASLPWWFTRSTLDVARYQLMPIGFIFVPLTLLGCWRMLRYGHTSRLVVALSPWGLVLLAACLRKYPYSCTRLEMFLAPGFLWVTVEGMAWLVDRLPVRKKWLAWPLVVLVGYLVGQSLHRVVKPWGRDASDVAAKYLLEHWKPGDGVVFNIWDYEYYLRNTPNARYWNGQFTPQEATPQPGKSLWVLNNSKPVMDAFVYELPSGWQVQEVIPFQGLRLFRLTPKP